MNTCVHPSRSGSLAPGMVMFVWLSLPPFILSGPSAPVIEPLTFRVGLPISFKSVGKCLHGHMQGYLLGESKSSQVVNED